MQPGLRPLVSVIVSNYNYARFLGESIDSILAQTWDRVEIIVVDDGSTDDSAAVIRGYGERVVPVFKQNGGQASALNAGFARSSGDMICLMDADDLWFPDKVAEVVGILSENPDVSWICHRMELTDRQLTPLGIVVPAPGHEGRLPLSRYFYLERAIRPPTPSLCFRRPLAERLFPIPEGPLPADRNAWPVTVAFDPDAYLVACCGAGEDEQGYAIPRVLGYYRRRTGEGVVADALLRRILVRQIGVERRASAAWSAWSGRAAVATTVFKHELIVATLDGEGALAPKRLRAFRDGMRGCLRMLPHEPRLAARQGIALTLAFAAPKRWLDRYVRVNLN